MLFNKKFVLQSIKLRNFNQKYKGKSKTAQNILSTQKYELASLSNKGTNHCDDTSIKFKEFYSFHKKQFL